MDAIEAILARHSVRDFSSKPVPRETIMKILEVATRSPSGGNGQPWEVFVASGATIEKIRKMYQERSQSGTSGTARPATPSGPPRPGYILERMNTIRNERLYQSLVRRTLFQHLLLQPVYVSKHSHEPAVWCFNSHPFLRIDELYALHVYQFVPETVEVVAGA